MSVCRVVLGCRSGKTRGAGFAAVFLALLCGASPCGAQTRDAFAARGLALDRVHKISLAAVRNTIIPAARAAAIAPGATAFDWCYLAELLTLVGDYHAKKFYEEAIVRDPEDPGYEWAYAQYLRVNRGAMEPLFSQAEAHLFAAERKLACISDLKRRALPKNFNEILTRAFVDLYQRDGLAVVAPPAQYSCPASPGARVTLFESVGMRAARTDVDLDRETLVRDLTAGLMLAQTRPPLSLPGAITPDSFLRANIRNVTPLAAVDRLRLRAGGAPAIDVFGLGQDSDNAQITKFVFDASQPDKLAYNAVKLAQYGFALDHPFTIFNVADAAVGLTYHRVRRWGVIEYLPQGREDINQLDVRGALSRFVGPDKVNAEFTFVNQGITPRTPNGLARDRQLYGGTLTYQIFRIGSAYARQFQNTRGIDLAFGVLHDLENYPFLGGNTEVTRRNYFASATVRAFHRFDLNIQPTVFTSQVGISDKPQYNSQYETAGYALYRIVDEERTDGLPRAWHGLRLGFVNIALPFHHDLARKGPDAFENYKVGAELSAKWFAAARRGVTFLGSARYDRQMFYNLGRAVNIAAVGLTMGF